MLLGGANATTEGLRFVQSSIATLAKQSCEFSTRVVWGYQDRKCSHHGEFTALFR